MIPRSLDSSCGVAGEISHVNIVYERTGVVSGADGIQAAARAMRHRICAATFVCFLQLCQTFTSRYAATLWLTFRSQLISTWLLSCLVHSIHTAFLTDSNYSAKHSQTQSMGFVVYR